MTTRIVRKLEFDAGHRLVGHEGKCRFLHGHRYVVELEVEAPQLDDIGRVIDFSCVKQMVGTWIDANLDHNMILRVDDPLVDQVEWERPPYLMEQNPTAENLAELLYHQAQQLLKDYDVGVVSVTVWETPNCRAVFFK